MRQLLAAAAFLAAGPPVFSQFDPPPSKEPDAATLQQIAERTAALKAAVAAVVKDLPEVHRADLEVYVKAAEWIVRHQEWFTADSGKQTLAVIDQGIQRAESAKGGKAPWLEPNGRSVARGYRSRIDDSVQPYGVVYPAGYGADPKKKWRLDVHLHGRDSSLTEVKHLNQHNGKPAPKDQDYVQLNIYGRGNNAYRWAGESDVFDVMDHYLRAEAAAGRKDLIDPRRVVLKGFSMGGAGTWHIGLRHPDKFAVLQPGAGFTTTHGYIPKLPDPLPDYQEKCLTIYDAFRYAENAFNIPVVAYSGEIDKQRQAAENIQAQLNKLGLSSRMTHLIGPGLEHKFPPEWQRAADAELRKHFAAAPPAGKHVRFVTHTLKQNRSGWVEVFGLNNHYVRARVDATWDDTEPRVVTANVTRLRLHRLGAKPFPRQVSIDGQKVMAATAKDGWCDFVRDEKGWSADELDLYRATSPVRKIPGLQGPIDDAFTEEPFLCIIGTGQPAFPAMHEAASAQLGRSQREWDKYMRGIMRVKKDSDVTEAELSENNLILFGDPRSNSVIGRALARLPLKWDQAGLVFGGKRYDPTTSLAIMAYPSPFHRARYVVLNSGHTFHEADFKGTNALLYPRLGDYAIVKPTPTAKDPAAFEVITAGLFDEKWQVPKK